MVEFIYKVIRRVLACILLVMAMGWVTLSTAHAEKIAVTVTSRVTPVAGGIDVELALRNDGDVRLWQVSADIHAVDGVRYLPVAPSLVPRQTKTHALTLSLPDMGGSYHLPVWVRYHDGGGKRHEAIHVLPIDLADVDQSVRTALIVMPRDGGKGIVELTVDNLSNQLRDMSLTWLHSDVISFKNPQEEVTVAPGRKIAVRFEYQANFSAPQGRYPLYVIVAGAAGGVHDSTLAEGLIELRATPSFFARLFAATEAWYVAILLLAAWLLLIAGYDIWRAWRRSMPS